MCEPSMTDQPAQGEEVQMKTFKATVYLRAYTDTDAKELLECEMDENEQGILCFDEDSIQEVEDGMCELCGAIAYLIGGVCHECDSKYPLM